MRTILICFAGYVALGSIENINAEEDSCKDKDNVGNGRIFTKDELKKYDGNSMPEYGIFLAIMGEVFDVTAGEAYYGPGKGYAAFSGRDGSRSFVSGDFTNEGAVESLDGLTPAEVAGVADWRSFYRKEEKYLFVGTLDGLYFDSTGKKTSYHDFVEEKLTEHERMEERKRLLKEKYPKCSSRWSQATGKEIWCNENLVPRNFLDSLGSSPRCACVDLARSTDAADGTFSVYENCSPSSGKCFG